MRSRSRAAVAVVLAVATTVWAPAAAAAVGGPATGNGGGPTAVAVAGGSGGAGANAVTAGTPTGAGTPARVADAAEPAGATATAAATPGTIDSCGTVEEPGYYVVTENLSSRGNCIDVNASDVTIDGNGHRVFSGADAFVTRSARAAGVNVTNLTVKNAVIVADSDGINVDTGRIDGPTPRRTGASADAADPEAPAVTVRNNTVRTPEGNEGSVGIELDRNTGGVVVRNNTVRGAFSTGLEIASPTGELGTATVVDNEFDMESFGGIRIESVSAGSVSVLRNVVRSSVIGSFAGLALFDVTVPVDVVGNRIAGFETAVLAVERGEREPIVLSADGPTVEDGWNGIEVHYNDLSENARYGVCKGTERLRLRGATVSSADPEESATGPTVEGTTAPTDDGTAVESTAAGTDAGTAAPIVNATHNYWGAPDGPSGPAGSPVADPVTGRLADGSGTAISVPGARCGGGIRRLSHAEATDSNVRFDPFLTRPDANFTVDVVRTNSPVQGGDVIEVTAQVTNVGAHSENRTVTLSVGARQRDGTNLELGGGESATVTLNWSTGLRDVGNYVATVATANDTDSTEVRVRGLGFSAGSGGEPPCGDEPLGDAQGETGENC